MAVEANRERKKKMWLTLDSLGLFLTRGRGKRQMSDKFWRLRGVLIISPVPCCVKSCSLTAGDRRGRWDRSLYSSVGFTCMPKLLLNGICKVILLMIAIVEEAHRERSRGKKTWDSDYGSDEACLSCSQRVCVKASQHERADGGGVGIYGSATAIKPFASKELAGVSRELGGGVRQH